MMVEDSLDILQIPSQTGILSVGGTTQDQGVTIRPKNALSSGTGYFWSSLLNASGTFKILWYATTGDRIIILAPDGSTIMDSTTIGTITSSAFTIPVQNFSDATEALITFQLIPVAARAVGASIADYTVAAFPSATEFPATTRFVPQGTESFFYTSNGFVAVVNRPVTTGDFIQMPIFNAPIPPATWTLTSSNTAVFANQSGTKNVNSRANIDISITALSTTSSYSATITFTNNSIGAVTCINPLTYTRCGTFWPNPGGFLPSTLQSTFKNGTAKKRRVNGEESNTSGIKKNTNHEDPNEEKMSVDVVVQPKETEVTNSHQESYYSNTNRFVQITS
jgi:hypothetical protein